MAGPDSLMPYKSIGMAYRSTSPSRLTSPPRCGWSCCAPRCSANRASRTADSPPIVSIRPLSAYLFSQRSSSTPSYMKNGASNSTPSAFLISTTPPASPIVSVGATFCSPLPVFCSSSGVTSGCFGASAHVPMVTARAVRVSPRRIRCNAPCTPSVCCSLAHCFS